MTTAVLAKAGRVAEQVREESRQLDPAKVALTLLTVVPFLCGWLAAQTVRACWAVLSWTWTAAVVGWRTAYGRGEPEGNGSG